jgi:hypothetical protein
VASALMIHDKTDPAKRTDDFLARKSFAHK